MTWMLILIYSGMGMASEPQKDLATCLQEAKSRLGEQLKVVAWDNMGGSNPIPHVAIAFCTQGFTQ